MELPTEIYDLVCVKVLQVEEDIHVGFCKIDHSVTVV